MSLLKQKSVSHQRIGYVSFGANFPDFQVTTFSAGTTAAWCSDHVAHHSTAVMGQWWKCHSKVLVWEMIPVVLSFSVFLKLITLHHCTKTVHEPQDFASASERMQYIQRNEGPYLWQEGVQLYPPS